MRSHRFKHTPTWFFGLLFWFAADIHAPDQAVAQSDGGRAAPERGGGGGAGGASPQRKTAGTLVSPDDPVPANGSLLLEAAGTKLGPVTLRDEADASVAGTVRELDTDPTPRVLYHVWTPAQSLRVGHVYTLTIEEVDGIGPDNVYAIQVVEPWTPARPDLEQTVELTRTESPIDACCFDPATGGNASCFPSEIDVWVNLNVILETTAPSSDLTQLLFGIGVGEDWQETAIRGYAPLRERTASEDRGTWSSNAALSQYCVKVEALEIQSGRVYEFPDLKPRCVPHGDLGEIESPVLEPPDELLARDKCPIPPWRHEQQWCVVNRACTTDSSASDCQRYAELCDRYDGSTGGTGGRGADARDAGAEDAGPSKPRTRDAAADRDEDDEDEGGCGVVGLGAGGRTSATAWTLLGAAITLVARRARRRPQRCGRCAPVPQSRSLV